MPTVDGSRTIAGLKKLRLRIVEAVALTLRDAEAAAITSAKGTTLFKDRTAGTRRSIGRGPTTGLSGTVVAHGAARLLEGGTVPHIITAKAAGTLRFTVNGEVLYRRVVSHPGTSPRPFMHEARNVAEAATLIAAHLHLGAAIAGV